LRDKLSPELAGGVVAGGGWIEDDNGKRVGRDYTPPFDPGLAKKLRNAENELARKLRERQEKLSRYRTDRKKYKGQLERYENAKAAHERTVSRLLMEANERNQSARAKIQEANEAALDSKVTECNKAAQAAAKAYGYRGLDGKTADQIAALASGKTDDRILYLGSEASPESANLGGRTPIQKALEYATPNHWLVFGAIDSDTLKAKKPPKNPNHYDHGHVFQLAEGTDWGDAKAINAGTPPNPVVAVRPLTGTSEAVTGQWQRKYYKFFVVKPE
jgi:hypothetical protein